MNCEKMLKIQIFFEITSTYFLINFFRIFVHIAPYNYFLEPNCSEENVRIGLCSSASLEYEISKTFQHPRFYTQGNVHVNDIGLIKLKNNVEYSNHIQPPCLPSSSLKPLDEMDLIAVGFGQTTASGVGQSSRRLKVKLPLFDFESCRAIYIQVLGIKKINNKRQFCAGGEPGKDTCTGDSGGPIFTHANGLAYLIGTISFGMKPCGGNPAVYTYVLHFIPWIKQTIEKNSCN